MAVTEITNVLKGVVIARTLGFESGTTIQPASTSLEQGYKMSNEPIKPSSAYLVDKKTLQVKHLGT